jgi:DNA-directed RNA polymerase subunit RPC12/RpoP
MEAFSAGTLAGAGSFRCGSCGFAVALHERDQVPECPSCGHRRFTRASLFAVFPQSREPDVAPAQPDWLDEIREGLAPADDYLAFEGDEGVEAVALREGWTRIGRSLAAHVRFDDPTVSRRHALLYRDAHQARLLDDRSLNGVFRNGRRVDLERLEDGDEIAIGRFRLYFLRAKRVPGRTAAEVTGAAG